MGLNTACGFTDDGLVWIRADGDDGQGKPSRTMLQMEPDQAHNLGVTLIKSAKDAMKAKKRDIKITGGEIVIPRG